MHGTAIEGLAYHNGRGQTMMGDGKIGSWGGAKIKGEVLKCDLFWKKFLHSDLYKLCLKQKRNIAELFPYMTMFFMRKITLLGNGVKISMFVNQSHINKPECNLSRIRIK